MNIKQWFYPPDVIRRLILSWLTAVTIAYAMVPPKFKKYSSNRLFGRLVAASRTDDYC